VERCIVEVTYVLSRTHVCISIFVSAFLVKRLRNQCFVHL